MCSEKVSLGCRLSVVMVSDFEPEKLKTWNDEKALVHALSHQDLEEDFEVLLIESTKNSDQEVPASLYEDLPGLKIHYFDSEKSAELKDYGVGLSKGEFVAVLESDCIPTSNWLRLLLAKVTETEWDVASGRTFYGEESSFRRVMNLLHRSGFDAGKSIKTGYISNNGAIYKREVLEKFPYPGAATPFVAAERRNMGIRSAGFCFYYERSATMRHDIGGLTFVCDLQRNKGHQAMNSISHRSILWIAKLLMMKLKSNCSNARRLGGIYLRWYDWPLFGFFVLFELFPYTVGTIDALKSVANIPGSSYR